MTLSEKESTQEINLRNNWEHRKDISEKIAEHGGYDVFDCNPRDGRRIFYIVRDQTPVGYVHCYEMDKKTIQINSAYLTEIVRARGLMTMVYTTIIKLGFTLISDWDRTVGAEALWKKLMLDPTLDVKYKRNDRKYIGKLR